MVETRIRHGRTWPEISTLYLFGPLFGRKLCYVERKPLSATNVSKKSRGLDNAGKTTIVKRIMGEDITTVSPTLGFIIKTIDYDG